MEKLEEVIGLEQYNRLNKGIQNLLNIKTENYNSVLLSLDNKESDTVYFVNHDSFPSFELDIETKQITDETIGYFPTGLGYYNPIKIFSPIATNENFERLLMVSNEYIFELTDVLISKENKNLTFSSSKIL